MEKISLLPDTNVFISNLDIIKQLFGHKFPGLCTLNISKVVIEELDFMKSKKKEARDAIKYIDSIRDSLNVEIEGHIDARKIEIEVERRQTIKPRTNDDKILNYALSLENPILLTNDVSFTLKCASYNITTIQLSKYKIKEILEMVSGKFSLIPSPVPPSNITETPKDVLPAKTCSPQQADTLSLEIFKGNIKKVIEPVIQRILYQCIGEHYSELIPAEPSLDFYLGFILNNFEQLELYLPAGICPIIVKLQEGFYYKNIDAILYYSKLLYTAFGYQQ